VYKRDASQVATYAPDGTDARWLGAIANVAGLQYSYVYPGGCDQMQAQLQIDPVDRVRALEPGRIMGIYRGASRVWDGKVDMPTPSSTGWQVNAHGSGQFGGDYAAYWSSGYTIDEVLNQAISNRGLRWVNPGLNGAATYWLSQPQDAASIMITDFLNNITKPVNLGWYIGRGNRVTIQNPIPTAVTHTLLTSLPAARTLQGYYDWLWLRYQSAADDPTSGNPAVFSTTSTSNTAQVAKHGQLEIYEDLSQVGTLTAGAAQAVGQTMLARYQATSFADQFTAGPGQLLTLGGVPYDLGVGMPGPMVCQVVVASNSYGGEVAPTPPLSFLVGGYTFFDDTQSAQLSAFQYAAQDLGGLFSNYVTLNTPPPATS
jgi:hypothetical protein